MKKFLFTLVLLFLNSSCVFAHDTITLYDDADFRELVLNDVQHIEHKSSVDKSDLFQTNTLQETPNFLKTSDSLTENTKIFSGITNVAKDIYNLKIDRLDSPQPLLSEYLTKKFDEGPVESTHLWGVFQSDFETTMTEGEHGNTKFNPALVNVLIDTKMRGGKDNFRLMLDMSHQHNRSFISQFVQDAYYETKRIPHHTILIGNSRTGTGYEGAQSPYTLPFVYRSQISRNLANIRKVGVRVKGNYSLVDYDFGGYSSDTFFTEFIPGLEFDGWVNLKPLGKTDGKYGKLTTGTGFVLGRRNSVDYSLGGAYIGYEYKKFWTRMEYAISDGSNGGSGLTNKRRQGWYVTVGYRLTKKLEILARYDEFDPDRGVKANNQREYTAGINYYLKGQALKLILNYIYCQNEAKPDSHRLLVGTQIAL